MTWVQDELPFKWPAGSWGAIQPFFGRKVRCWFPVLYYSGDWHDGMRFRVYEGTVAGHHEGGFCLQPPYPGQGWEYRGRCIPLTGESGYRLELADD